MKTQHVTYSGADGTHRPAATNTGRLACLCVAMALTLGVSRAEESVLPVFPVSPVDINRVELLTGVVSFETPSVSIGPADRTFTHVVKNHPIGYMYRVRSGTYAGRIEYGPSSAYANPGQAPTDYAQHIGFVKNGFNIATGFGDDFRGADITGPSNAFSEPNPNGTRNLYCRPNTPVGDATDCDHWGFRVAGHTFTFKSQDRVGTFQDLTEQGNTVAKVGANWIFTTRDGTQIATLDTNLDDGSNFAYPNGRLEWIKHPSGLQVNVHYVDTRISLVSRNDGFAFKYFYETPLGRSGVAGDTYFRPNRIVAYNMAVDYCDPAAVGCTFSRTWPNATFSWTHNGSWNSPYTTYFTITDSGGAATRYTLDKFGRVIAEKPASSSVDTVTYEICSNNHEFFDFPAGHPERRRNCIAPRDPQLESESPEHQDQIKRVDNGQGIVWTYTRASDYVSEASRAFRLIRGEGPAIEGVPSLSGETVERGVHPSELRLTFAANPYGASASFDGTPRTRQTSTSRDDRGVHSYGYDARGNVTSLIHTATDLTRERTAGYPATCSNRLTCNKPDWIKDYEGNQTDFTYDPAHGGVLTATGPAPSAGAPRPQTRSIYQQRFAWIRNSSGAFVRAPTAIWMLTEQSMCREGPAATPPAVGCAIAGDEVRTRYEYGPNTGPNNLVQRGLVLTSNTTSFRTCFAYDAIGNRIAETTPNAALTNCP